MTTELLHYLGRVLPAVYALSGVALGGWITWRSQRKHWVRDNKKQEYRDLLDGLFRATEEIIKARPNVSAALSQALVDATWSGTRLVQNRIFVARRIREGGIVQVWQKIVSIAIWEPTDPKIRVNGEEYAYTTGAISLLRGVLEEKLLAIIQKDLGI